MYRFFKSDFFNFEFQRVLGTAAFGGADQGECLDAAAAIRNDDPESWYSAWIAQAERAAAVAGVAAAGGDRLATREALLRASNYFRAAQYMLVVWNERPDNVSIQARKKACIEKSVAYFRRATELLDAEVRVLDIPYQDGHHLPGYLFLPPPSKKIPGRKTPVLINCGGADSTQEELYSLFGATGPERGYAVLTYEGPGQGIVIRRDGLVMRHDWEAVISRVLDHLWVLAKDHPELDLDLDHIGVAGASMGAYYALRAAADKRIAGCVAIDPIYDMWDLATDRMPPSFINAWLHGWLSDGFFNAVWKTLSRLAFQLRWEITHCMSIFGVHTAADAMREMRLWTLRGDDTAAQKQTPFLSRVQCPVLVSGACGTIYTKPEISTLRVLKDLDHLPEDKKEVWIAKDVADGGLQAKVGAWRMVQQRTFGFLDRQFGIQRTPIETRASNASTNRI